MSLVQWLDVRTTGSVKLLAHDAAVDNNACTSAGAGSSAEQCTDTEMGTMACAGPQLQLLSA